MKKALALFMCVALCFLSACGKGGKTGKDVTLYFIDTEKKNMVTEVQTLPGDTIAEVAAFAVNALIKGPEGEQAKKAFPDGVTLLDIKIADNIATVNLSSQFNTGTKIDKLWSRYTLINTLCDLEGISKTQILVEGDIITSISNNEPLGPMGKEDIVTDINQVTNDTAVATLYFSDENGMKLAKELREIVLKEGETLEKAVIEELIKGPKNKGLYQVLPQGVKVLSAETKDGVCFLNLSAEFNVSGMGSSAEELTVYSIVNTLCEIEAVSKVQILVEGKKIDGFGHLDLSEAIGKNKDILE